jgi:site-specific DNA recombinase
VSDSIAVIGYVRRSTKSDERTVSLEDQSERIRDYCQERGWMLVEILTDDGVSGRRRERLARISDALRRCRARGVVVYHLDRFARDVAAMLDQLEAWARKGIALYVVGRGRIGVEDPSDFLATGVEGLVADHFRRVVSKKTRDAMARLRIHRRRISGHLPYGYRLAADGRHLEPHPGEQAALALIRTLARGRSLRALSRELASRGVVARCGRPFAAETLRALVSDGPVSDRATLDGAVA